MPRPLIDHILEALPRRDACFVFPAAAPANFWLRKAALESGQPIAARRFMAWDQFKAETLVVSMPGREAAGRAARIIFATRLLAENAACAETETGPLLGDFISGEYAAAWQSFVPPLTRLLPGLDPLLKQAEVGAALSDDPYFADLALIRHRYGVFLEQYGLYEPAWSRAAFDTRGREWFLFFPELAEDWEDYRQDIASAAQAGAVHVISVEDIAAPKAEVGVPALPPCIRFADSGDELRSLALTLRWLLDAGFPPADIAVSFPGVERDGERLARELALRDVPAVERGGRPLTEHPGGRIFTSLSACGAGRWSYVSLKNLLLDRAYPWKDEKAIDGLMEAGLRYRCVANFGTTDVWLESLKNRQDSFMGVPVAALRDFYAALKRDIETVTGAKTFDGLKKAWHVFESRYFDRGTIGEATDKIIARAMMALDELAAAAERFNTDTSGDGGEAWSDSIGVYGIFLSYLGETSYAFQPPQDSVAIYDYRVAAGIAPAFHFVINMNQNDASVISGVPIREDRKAALGLQDRDLSAAFAAMYARSGSRVVFSFSQKTFSGPAVPLQALSGIAEIAGAEKLPFPAEPDDTTSASRAAEALRILFAGPGGVDMRAQALPEGLRPAGGRNRYSPTDLDEVLRCPFKWFLERILGICEKQTEIATIDQRDLGTMYHRVLEGLFNKIRADGMPFSRTRMADYADWLNGEADAVINDERRRDGAFQAPVYDMLRGRIAAALTFFVENMTAHFEGALVLGSEVPLRRDYDDIALAGKADLILEKKRDGTSSFIITDFKTGAMPSPSELLIDSGNGETVPRNVQAACYVTMIEHGRAGRAEDVRFYSIDKRSFQPVIGGEPGKGKLPVSRTDYQKEIDAVDTILAETAARTRDGLFTIPPEGRRRCGLCSVQAVCRLQYSGGEPA